VAQSRREGLAGWNGRATAARRANRDEVRRRLASRRQGTQRRAGRIVSACEKILDRLQGVRQSSAGRWIAKCPAHDDRAPSLSIREKEEDGRVLLHCFGGCTAGDVLAVIGLRFNDLFDKPLGHFLPPIRGGFTSRELLELIGHESCVVADLAERAAAGEALSPDDLQRLRTAAARLGQAQALANVR
jgi:hypothetical protein